MRKLIGMAYENYERKSCEFRTFQKKYFYVKRAIGFMSALLGIIILLPLFLIIILIIEIEEPGSNPFFTQKRVGKNKSYFNILKFRTMKVDTPSDVATHLLQNPEQYITKIGAFLRKSSLDELLQLFNVLKGDMAFVGPRPALWNQFDLITERDKYGVNDVAPGITGWAQVHGRDELQINEKARLDSYYVKHFGLFIDIKCIFLTVYAVVSRKGMAEGDKGQASNCHKR